MATQKLQRYRGFILTPIGLQKLQEGIRKLETQTRIKYSPQKLSQRVQLIHPDGIHPGTVRKILRCKEGVDRSSIALVFEVLKLTLEEGDYVHARANQELTLSWQGSISSAKVLQDWAEAIDVSVFYGRTQELQQLEQWLLGDRCRLIAILGMGGIGKTALSVKFAQQMQHHFDYTIWRSLRNAPKVEDIIAQLIQFLSNQQEINLPNSIGDRIARLIKYLGSSRCLVILDNVEAILQSGDSPGADSFASRAGYYREGYEEYGDLLKCVGETLHSSCLMLTSREKPKEIALLEGVTLPVRSLQLGSLQQQAGQAILRDKGLYASENDLCLLVERYGGNPLALKIVATTLQDVFGGSISEFLSQETAIFGDIRNLLDQQFYRLSNVEKEVAYWLAINREPISLSELQEDMLYPVPQLKLIETLESTSRRSLIEKSIPLSPSVVHKELPSSESYFTLQPVVMEYITEQLIEQVCSEITNSDFLLLKRHVLLKATAKDYVRETQVRLILQPVIDKLVTIFGSNRSIEKQLTKIIALLKTSALEPGYTAGNVLNLLCQLQTDLSGYDFSNLSVWQADLRQVNLHNASFQNADLAKSVFASSFGGICSLAFSPDQTVLAVGDTNGEVRLYQAAHHQQLLTCRGHTSWAVSIAFSVDGSILASGSTDNTVKLWEVNTGQCLQTLHGHSNYVWSVAFSPVDCLLASGSDDRTIRLWNIRSGECLKITGHTSWVRAVAFHPDGQILASGSDDRTIRLWHVGSGECIKIFQGHCERIQAIAFSPDGTILASGSEDRTVRLWDVKTGKTLKIFRGHNGAVWSVAFSPDGTILASGSDDSSIRLWDVKTGQVKTFTGHNDAVWSVAFSPDGTMLASGGDRTVRLWDVSSGECVRTFTGHTQWVWSVAFSPDGKLLASSSVDRTLRLWSIKEGECLRISHGHTNWVKSVVFSPDGQMLASCSHDRTVRLWDVRTGECLKILQGHTSFVWSVAFSPDNRILASASEDETVKLWDVATGECLQTLRSAKPYEGMNITGITGLSEATIASLKALGAVEYC